MQSANTGVSIMTISSLTAAPDLPDRTEQDQAVFDTRMAAYWAYLKDDFEPELNVITGEIDTATSTINGYKTDAETAETNAAASADLAEEWAIKTDGPVSGSEYSAKYHASAASDSADEAANSAQSAISAPGTSATSTTELTIGTGSKTLTIQTGKNIVEGMFIVISNTGTPANHMIGQVTSYNSGTGELVVDVEVTGGSGTLSAWTISLTSGRLSFGVKMEVFTSSGTFTPAAGITEYEVILTGGGGSSQGNTTTPGSGGGGAGGTCISNLTLTEAQTVTIGSGGTLAGNGGQSTFGSILTAYGGTGVNKTSSGGAGGEASGGDINITGGDGDSGITNGRGGIGGSSYWGGGGRGEESGDTGGDGKAYGSGGGGNSSTTKITNGKQGICVVRWIG